MNNRLVNRRDFSLRLATLLPALSLPGNSMASAAAPADGLGISHTAEAIRQVVVFKASPTRVYNALTRTEQFDKIVGLSGVRQSGMLPPGANQPTQIDSGAGGSFALFGGFITGRHIELLPGVRIVQAWREGSWAPGVYSIAKFELVARASQTEIIFDHTGFPRGAAQSLSSGWNQHYWEPLAKFLA